MVVFVGVKTNVHFASISIKNLVGSALNLLAFMSH